MLLALACAAPPEVDVPYDAPLARLPHGLQLAGQAITDGGQVLAERLYEAPVVREGVGTATVLVAHEHDGHGRVLRLDWNEGWTPRVLVDDGGRPDRLSLSPDGEVVAFVWGRTGLASVWTVRAGEAPVQRTNVGLVRTPGAPPAGFVPPPTAPPAFDGDRLVWRDAPELSWR